MDYISHHALHPHIPLHWGWDLCCRKRSSNLLFTCTSCFSCGQLILILFTAQDNTSTSSSHAGECSGELSAISPASVPSMSNSSESDCSNIGSSSRAEEATGWASARGVRTSELSDEDWECAAAVSSPPDRSILLTDPSRSKPAHPPRTWTENLNLIKHSLAGAQHSDQQCFIVRTGSSLESCLGVLHSQTMNTQLMCVPTH